MIKYIGSKRLLVPRIVELARGLPKTRSAVDLFSGTARVGHGLKRAGFRVASNDLSAYAATLARCYVQADLADHHAEAKRWVAHLNTLEGQPGYITRTFCEQARFFRPENGARIDAMRQEIASAALDDELEAILLTSLIEAADRVDSTTGVQMAFLKNWAARAHRPIQLRVPELLRRPRAGKSSAHQLDARDAARVLTGDVGYLDPPYNQHKYLNNYHVWETIVRNDQPEHYGIVCKRIECADHRSAFNSRREIRDAIADVVEQLDTRYLIVSFNDEGFIPPDELLAILSARGQVWREEIDYPRYIGAQIGIHNHRGEVVGEVSHIKNKENLFVVLPKGARHRPDGMRREA